MNLADWISKDHDDPERFRMAASLCKAVAEASGPMGLDPARVPVSGGECQPEAGRSAPPGRYRAPETGEGQAPTAQAQVYTAGVLCYEILGGRAFEARGGSLLRDVRPDLPRDLSDAVQACLEMDAEWRPKDITYLQGLVEGQITSGSAPSKSAPRAAARPQAAAAPAPRTVRRKEPAPRPWPLLLVAVAALAVSIGIAVIRLRQPVEAPPVPPPVSVPPRTTPTAAPATEPTPAPATTPEPGHHPAATPPPSVAPVRETPAPAPSPSAKTTTRASAAPATGPSPVAVVAATTPAPVATPPPATTTPPPATQAPAEPAAPAAVTAVSPPVLRRGSTTLVDVHGVGMRGEHQVRLARGREAAKGIEVVRQRFVNATLLQVLLKVDAAAAPGGYTLGLVDGAGQATNTRPFEIAK